MGYFGEFNVSMVVDSKNDFHNIPLRIGCLENKN